MYKMHWRPLLLILVALLLAPGRCSVTTGSSSGSNQLLRTYMHQLLTAAQEREDNKFVGLLGSGNLALPWNVGALAVKSSFDDTIRAGLESARKILAATLEPLELDRVSLDSQDQVQGFVSKGFMEEVAIKKLSEFKVEEVQSNIERLYIRLGVKFDTLDMFAKYYEVDAKLDDHLHFFGNGSMKMRVYDLSVTASTKFGYRDEHFHVKDVDIQVSLKKAKVLMENLMGGGALGDVTNGVIGDVLPEYIDEFKEEISTSMSTAVANAINKKLLKLSLDDILELAGVPKPTAKAPLHS